MQSEPAGELSPSVSLVRGSLQSTPGEHVWAQEGAELQPRSARCLLCGMGLFLNLSKLCFHPSAKRHPEAFDYFDKPVLCNHLMACVLVLIAAEQIASKFSSLHSQIVLCPRGFPNAPGQS